MPRTKKKVKSIVKTKVISVRVTETTHELLHQQAEDAGMTLSEFAAQMLMKGRVNTSYVFYVHPDEIEAITREFAAIGNNLNQIAAFFNSGGIQSRAMLENINHAISCIFEMREQVAEMAGKNYGNLKAHRKQEFQLWCCAGVSNFQAWIGSKRLIKRRRLDEYLDKAYSI